MLTPALDRQVLSPTWSADGPSVLFLLEDDRVYHLARVPAGGGPVARVVEGRRTVSDLSVGADGKVAVLASTPAEPAEIFAVENGTLRRITHQNDAWLAQVKLAKVEEVSFKSFDGTRINGFVVKPPDYGRAALPDDSPPPRRTGLAALQRFRELRLAALRGQRLRGDRRQSPGQLRTGAGLPAAIWAAGARRTARTCSRGWTTWWRQASPMPIGSASEGTATAAYSPTRSSPATSDSRRR